MLLLTVLLLAVLMLFSFFIFDRDLFAPPTVVSLGLLFASLCALYNENRWGLDFSGTTMRILVSGVAAFIVGGIIAVFLAGLTSDGRVGLSHQVSPAKPIVVERSKTLIVIACMLITIVMEFTEMRRLTGETSWISMVSAFRDQTANVDPSEYSMRFSGVLILFLGASFAVAYVYTYIVGNNVAAHYKQPIINWVPILCYILISFMQGYRGDMLRFWVALFIIIFTIKKRSVGWKNSEETNRTIIRIALSVIVIGVIFVAMRRLVGRTSTKDPLYYVTFYAGSSIAAFDLFLKDPLPPSAIWGKETFYDLNQSISAWFHKPELRYFFFKEFRTSPNGTTIGNIYTAFRPPYYDFGYVGMLIYLTAMGLFYTLIYCKVRDRFGRSEIDFRLLLYSYFAYTFFMYFYNSYNGFISFGFVRTILEMLVIRWFLVGWHGKTQYTTSLLRGGKMKFVWNR